MERTNRHRSLTLATGLALACGLAPAFAGAADPSLHAATAPATEKYLYVWAGDQARQGPDFLAVVDFDESSPGYGKVLGRVPVPGAAASGNEPHHVGLSADGRVLAAGGLLSVLKGQPEIFFFDLSQPAAPKFLAAADPPQSAITDEFYPLPDGGFLVTMMGGAAGHHPGRIAEFGPDLKLRAEHPERPPDDGFNPHGISVRPDLDLMVTSDFICPTSTLHAVPGDLALRGSVRVWRFSSRELLRTIPIPGAPGTIDVQLIPGDREGRGYTAGMGDDRLYLLDTKAGAARAVFDFSAVAKGGWPQLMRLTRDGKRLFASMNQAGKVAMLDVSDPERPALLATLDLGAGAGPHYLALTGDEKRLVVTDYFLNEDAAGKVHAEGDHRVHVAQVTPRGLALDPRFRLDFDDAFDSGPARPHGVAFK
ncbi:MAG: selenium-binding protein SBP56-related protein [Thermoanaerobaculia bacterium]